MPLEIIRNDITRVRADAIVNTANPEAAVGRGTDYAIYRAAGMDDLLDARAKIGIIRPGEAAVTPGFALDADYIIHTVGPAWKGGIRGEEETVAECYRNCLDKADGLGCESIAFPLISTGTYGFPKELALNIAIREISDFLENHDMDVKLVVYDKESFALSSELFEDIRSYISDADVVYQNFAENRAALRNYAYDYEEELTEADILKAPAASAPSPKAKGSAGPAQKRSGSSILKRWKGRKETYGSIDGQAEEMAEPLRRDTGAYYSPEDIDETLAALIRTKDETFQQKLFRMIDSRGMKDPEVYKRANIDRKLFSKIRSNINYNPTKRTAVAFAIALGLNLDETTDLLRSAGYSLSPSSSFDIIIRYCIEHGITNIHEINCILFEFDQILLGA